MSRIEAKLFRAAGWLLAPGGRRGSLIVLMYHRVLPEPDELLFDEPDAKQFASQMDLIQELFTVLSLAEAAERLAGGSLPKCAAAITFDDGYVNNLEVAAPILMSHGLTATCFVATAFIDGGRMWNDVVIDAIRQTPPYLDLRVLGLGEFRMPDIVARRRVLNEILSLLKYLEPSERVRKAEAIASVVGAPPGRPLMMSERQLRELSACGFEIGAHTLTHPILSRLPAEVARREIVESKLRLEGVLGTSVRCFAYPNGRPGIDYGLEHVVMVREAGYDVAVTTASGAASHLTDRFQIPRVAPWDKSPVKYAARLLKSQLDKQPRAV